MGLFGKFSVVGLATLASRFLGFFREALIAAILGAGPVADAFTPRSGFQTCFADCSPREHSIRRSFHCSPNNLKAADDKRPGYLPNKCFLFFFAY